GLTAFGVYAGIGLWRIRPGAVDVAKRYLWCFLGYHVICVFTILLYKLEAVDAKFTVRGISHFAIWYLYLTWSKRVKATYADLRVTPKGKESESAATVVEHGWGTKNDEPRRSEKPAARGEGRLALVWGIVGGGAVILVLLIVAALDGFWFQN